MYDKEAVDMLDDMVEFLVFLLHDAGQSSHRDVALQAKLADVRSK